MGLSDLIPKKIGAKIYDFATGALAFLTNPIATTSELIKTGGITQQAKLTESKSTGRLVGEGVLNTLVVTGGVVGATKAVTAAKAGTLSTSIITASKTLIPTTTKGKIVAAVVAPVAVGAILKEPIATAKAAAKIPEELIQFGGDVATFAAEPSLKTAKEIIVESPLITAALATAGVVAAGNVLIPAVVAGRQISAVEEQTKAIKEATAEMGGYSNIPITPQNVSEQGVGIETPPQRETTTITTGKTRRKRPKIKETPSIRQNVRVNVITSSRSAGIRLTKKYLNKEVLAY